MAQQPPNNFFPFVCCPDPTFGEPVNEFRKKGVTGLMTSEGLDFIRTYVRNNGVVRGSLEPPLESDKTDKTTWQLAFLETTYQRPGCAVCWIGMFPLKARVFLLLGKGSNIIFYNGSESLQREQDNFDMYQIPEDILRSKVRDGSIGRCKMNFEDGGILTYGGRTAYDLFEGSLIVFGFVPEEISGSFAKGMEKFVLPESLREKAEELSTERIKFIFRFK